MMDSDIENDRVVVNWFVTAVILLVAHVGFGVLIGADLLGSFVIGLLVVAVWIANELRTWTPGEDIDAE